MSITPTSEEDSPPIGLFYDKEELNDVLTRLLLAKPERCSFTAEAKDYIYRMTYGHPGAVKAVGLYLFEVCLLSLYYIYVN